MIIRFVVENFLSFQEETEFNMLSGSFKIHKEHIYKEKEGVNLLRTAAIYGANGAGKSNFAIAVDTARDLILGGTMTSKQQLPHHYFLLDKKCSTLPTKFEFEFKSKGTIYSYGMAFYKNRIAEEWLYKTHPKKEDELVFERETSQELKTTIKLHPQYLSTPKEQLKAEIYGEEIRPNEPFITEAHDKDLAFIQDAYFWFSDILEVIFPDSKPDGLFENLLFNQKYHHFTNQILNLVDTGVRKIEVQEIELNSLFGLHEKERKEEILNFLEKENIHVETGNDDIDYGIYLDKNDTPKVVKLVTKHQVNGSEVTFNLSDESDGTQRFIELTPAFIDSMYKGKVYIVDEMNRSMHPQMLRKLVEMYLQSDNTLSQGQLIFTTHESNLLDLKLFRQDEVWFVEKNKEGASSMYSLSDFKPRYDKDIRRGYLQGRFGAIPFTSKLVDLNW